jgi:hypothetical protein
MSQVLSDDTYSIDSSKDLSELDRSGTVSECVHRIPVGRVSHSVREVPYHRRAPRPGAFREKISDRPLPDELCIQQLKPISETDSARFGGFVVQARVIAGASRDPKGVPGWPCKHSRFCVRPDGHTTQTCIHGRDMMLGVSSPAASGHRRAMECERLWIQSRGRHHSTPETSSFKQGQEMAPYSSWSFQSNSMR